MRIPMVTATPVPSPSAPVDPDLVTPGPWGFVVIALLAAIVILLIMDMMRRIRRGRVRADIQEQLDAEASEQTRDPDSPDADGDERDSREDDTRS